MNEKQKPEMKYRVGSVTATIWKNKIQTQNGEVDVFKTDIVRNYKTKTGEWGTTSSFDKNDLPQLILAAQKAYEHLALKETD